MANPWTIRARWTIPVDGPPIEGGVISVLDDKIVSVAGGRNKSVDLDFEDCAIIPALVNAHTHLDLGGLCNKLARPGDFIEWLRAVVDYRRNSDESEWATAIQAGIQEGLAHGTGLLCDISGQGLSATYLRAAPFRSFCFYELIGLSRERARATIIEARQWLAAHQNSERFRVGLSPHAPYTVRNSLYRWAESRNISMAIHLNEWGCEGELLAERGGPLRNFLEQLRAWDESGLAQDHAFFLDSGRRNRSRAINSRPMLFVHMNYALRDFRPRPPGSIVFCPRTHKYFGHPPHPVAQYIQAGLNVCLGTDSLASNPDLSILEEMRFLHRRRPDLDRATILHMGTLAGATALGFAQQTGSLTPGKSADFAVVPILDRATNDPYVALFESEQSAQQMCLSGQWVMDNRSPARKL